VAGTSDADSIKNNNKLKTRPNKLTNCKQKEVPNIILKLDIGLNLYIA